MAGEATADGPAQRRSSWNLKAIVEDVTGKSIGEFQDPNRPVHPYLQGKIDPAPPAAAPRDDGPPYDPVAHLYPPLNGPTARAFHGPEHEHHQETLERHRPDGGGNGRSGRGPGPSSRPERLYLHYLLLHVDRLSDSGLRYLLRVVEEELAHRATPMPPPSPPPNPAPPSAG